MGPPIGRLASLRLKFAFVILAAWCLEGGVQAAEVKQWCLAKSDANTSALQGALSWACSNGADCAPIQDGAASGCSSPPNLVFRASYAFNSYWQEKKSAGGTCDFAGVAYLENTTDPSTSDCQFQNGPTPPGPIAGPPPEPADDNSKQTALKIFAGCLSASVTASLAVGAFIWRSRMFRNEKLLILTAAGKLLTSESSLDGGSDEFYRGGGREDNGLTAIKLDIARMTLNCWDGLTLGPKRDFNMQPVGIWEERFRHKRAALLLWAATLYDERRATQGLPPLPAVWREVDKAAKKRFAHDIAMIVVTVDYDVLSKELAISDLPAQSMELVDAKGDRPLVQHMESSEV